jgi:periplasmic divalent cation tolerance protein
MYIVVFITVANKKEAAKISDTLIRRKLAACVNIAYNVESVFWWQKKVDRAKEALLVVKSTKAKLSQLIKAVKSMHSYTVPEIIALPIVGGFKPYLEWIDGSLR